jgi:adenine-specific DNA-methyltransferase
MVLDEPAILLQRTTAPEQRRRIVAIELTEEIITEWGGRVVVENHVNVLRPAIGALMSRNLVIQLLRSDVVERLVRCISGSVALSAYELESLPLPDATVLAAWENMSDRCLISALQSVYAATT